MLRKLRTRLRALLRKSGMGGAVIALALGIGANTAIFNIYAGANAKPPRHYVFFGMDREKIKEALTGMSVAHAVSLRPLLRKE